MTTLTNLPVSHAVATTHDNCDMNSLFRSSAGWLPLNNGLFGFQSGSRERRDFTVPRSNNPLGRLAISITNLPTLSRSSADAKSAASPTSVYGNTAGMPWP